jgi:hypothetical protein
VVVAEGDAEGEAQFVHERPVEGLHEYVAAPVAVRVVDVPLQIDTAAPALTTGTGLTFTVIVPVPVQPREDVPVIVYVVVVVGFAVGLAQLVHERPVAGLQEYVDAPFAFRTTEPLPHMVWFVPVMTGVGLITTVLKAVSEQPLAVVTTKRTLYVPPVV